MSKEQEYDDLDGAEVTEGQALLSTKLSIKRRQPICELKLFNGWITISLAPFIAGAVSVLLFQAMILWLRNTSSPATDHEWAVTYPAYPTSETLDALDIANPVKHKYPPPYPTNAITSLFPTKIGYAGPTGTGAEPALIVTAPVYPSQSDVPWLVVPAPLKNGKKHKESDFDPVRSWGNLSPWYSVEKGAFGVDHGPETPEKCEVTSVHLLHRHGARYPTYACK